MLVAIRINTPIASIVHYISVPYQYFHRTHFVGPCSVHKVHISKIEINELKSYFKEKQVDQIYCILILLPIVVFELTFLLRTYLFKKQIISLSGKELYDR